MFFVFICYFYEIELNKAQTVEQDSIFINSFFTNKEVLFLQTTLNYITMKKLLFTLTLALLCVGLSAQDGLKGVWFGGGQVAFNSSKDKDTDLKTNSTTVLPIFGTFVSPSVAVGAGIGYIGSTAETYRGESIKAEAKSNIFVFKPLVRKYWNITGGLYFFGQAALPLQFGNQKTTIESTEGKANITDIALELSPGFDYVVNSWLTIETSFTILNMGYNQTKPKGGKGTTSFGFNANPFNSIGDRTVGELQVGVKFLF